MFTIEQIKAAHSKVTSGADFPKYVQDLIQLGVTSYDAYVVDGHTAYFGAADYKVVSAPKYAPLTVAAVSDIATFIQDLKAHQAGKTDYPTFCADCAKNGIEKWVVDMAAMTCTYFDKAGNNVLVEVIPQ